MSNELAAENLRLRKQLAQLMEQAQHNQRILKRYQIFDLQFIGAASFRELLDTLFHGFAQAVGLDIVTLSLLDPDYDIRRMLAELNIHPIDTPNLFFLQDTSELGELRRMLGKPLLGGYSEELHGMLFPEPIITPASVAIMPLMRQQRLIGHLGMGSLDKARFTDGMATDFIEHMASIVAICLENVINNERLKHIGMTDPLTGVNNRRYVEQRLIEEVGRSQRQGYALSCMYIDIDHFKRINDSIGHQAGDEVLCAVAARIKAELRLTDALGRFGGEEFVVALIDAGLHDAANVAERIRQSIAEQPLVLLDGTSLDVTVSIGITALTRHEAGRSIEAMVQEFVARADRALYQAKEGGRNRVVALA